MVRPEAVRAVDGAAVGKSPFLPVAVEGGEVSHHYGRKVPEGTRRWS